MKILNIIQGWSAYLRGNENELARQRAEVCKGCNKAVIGTYEIIMPDYSIKEIQGLKCKDCGCPLSTKLRSRKEKCPLGKW